MKKLFLLILLPVLFFACSSDDKDEPEVPQVTAIKINEPTEPLFVDGTCALKVTHTPANLEAPIYVWESSDKAIATVTNKGEVKALKEGKVKITTSVEKTKLTSTIEIEIKPVTVVTTSIKLDKETGEIGVGEKLSLKATVEPANATVKDVTWTSSDETIATVINGEVTGVKAGEVVIKASIGNLKAECKLTVKAEGLKSIAFDASNLELEIDDSYTLSIITDPDDFDAEEFEWNASNPEVAEVDFGTIIAHKEGTSIITLKLGDSPLLATCKVTVVKKSEVIEPTGIKLSLNNVKIPTGGGVEINYTILPKGADAKPVFTSSDMMIAAYNQNSGQIINLGRKPGTATVTATITVGDKIYSDQCVVTVE